MAQQMICLDTSVLIDFYRKTEKEKSLFYKLAKEWSNFAISAVTEYEIMAGATQWQNQFWVNFLNKVEVLNFDTNTANIAANIRKDLKEKNKLIEVPDILIAASAIQHDIYFATLNKKHFERIDKLKLV